MRKVLVFLFAVFILSCNKDAGCYDCKITITINVKDGEESYSYSVVDTQTKCELSDDEIKEYENNNTGASTYTNGSLSIDTVMVTVCTK
jgi:hypothetical protein